MKTYRVGFTLLIGSIAGVATFGTGCSLVEDGGEPKIAVGDERLGSVSMQLVENPDFKGNSVVVCGKRAEKSDGKYPCIDEFCRCLDFGSDGKTEKIADLCPSANLGPNGLDTGMPGAGWDFSYVIYNGECKNYKEAKGLPLTDPNPKDAYEKNDHNFVCFDKETPFKYPNQTIGEWLKPGKNHNDIFCVTKNASKDFNFDVCVDESYDSKVRLDCGCWLDTDPNCPPAEKCKCGENGVKIPKGFYADPNDACRIKAAY